MTAWVRSIAESFTPEHYLLWTRIQGSLWTFADIVIVLYLLLITNILRIYIGKRPHRFSYVILAATVPPALFLPVAPSGWAFFRLELAITIPHFVLLLYLCAVDAPIAATALAKRFSIQAKPPALPTTYG